jgi:decaprenyl-phosphate phosphoribosyltransferase
MDVQSIRAGAPPADLRDLMTLVRPGQWLKNVLVTSVALLDLGTWHAATVWRLGLAIVMLTIASSFVYVINDITDRHLDRAHPTKRDRPVAAGRISVPVALALAAVHLVALVVLLSQEPLSRYWPIPVYLVLATAYSMALKHVPLVDVFVVATGFGLRLVQGYVALGVAVSGWLLICVFALCLLLALGKRRHEVATTGGDHRPALRGYTVALIDQLMVLCTVQAVGSYLLYLRTEAPLGRYGAAAAVACAPLALFGLFRYLQLVLVQENGGNPVRLLARDPALVVNSLLWLGLSGAFLLASRIG